MEIKNFIIYFLTAMVLGSCKKEDLITNISQKSFIETSLDFLKANLSAGDYESLNLSSLLVFRYHNQELGIQIFQNDNLSNFILLHKEAEKLVATRVSISGLRSNLSKEHNGVITLTSLKGEFTKELIVRNNIVTETITSDVQKKVPGIGKENRPEAPSSLETYLLPEVVIVVSGGGGSTDFFSLFWLFDSYSSFAGLYSSEVGNNGSYAGGAGGNNSSTKNNVTAALRFVPPKKRIFNIKKELECFVSNPSSTYFITVNVNQPSPDSRELVDAYSDFIVGHTFLTLSQNNADGTSVIRTIGFYPKNMVKPIKKSEQGVFGDDSDTPADVSLKIAVSGDDLLTVVNTLSQQESNDFNLDNFNCTNSAIEALKSIGINLPATNASDLLFHGYSPADMGQDIRHLNLNDFSAANGNRQMIRMVSAFNDINPPKRTEDC